MFFLSNNPISSSICKLPIRSENYNCTFKNTNKVSIIIIIIIIIILNFIAKSLQLVRNVHSSLYADVNGFLNPSIITGENYRPDRLFLIQSKCLYVLELTVGFQSNLNNNAVRKKEKYLNLINEMSRNYTGVCEICKSFHEFPWRFFR